VAIRTKKDSPRGEGGEEEKEATAKTKAATKQQAEVKSGGDKNAAKAKAGNGGSKECKENSSRRQRVQGV
jgi:hypothetical protein